MPEKALRNACTAFLRALWLMYAVRVCAYCGMLHHADFNLCDMVFECADRLRFVVNKCFCNLVLTHYLIRNKIIIAITPSALAIPKDRDTVKSVLYFCSINDCC